MTSTNALPTAARKVIPARIAGKACEYCGTSITPNVDHAFLVNGTWFNACATCAASHVAQVQGLLARVEAAATNLPEAGKQALQFQAQREEAGIIAVLQGTSTAPEATVQALQGMLATAAAFAPAPAAPVRANAYPGKCATCGTRVEAGAGRYERVSGVSTVWHLDGQCPTEAAAPATPATDLPLGMHQVGDKVVKVYLTQNNRKAGKVLVGASFRYEKGATVGLSEATLMTAEQARAYGRQTNTCCNCAKEIGHGDTEATLQSLAQGYGPDCAARNGWPTVSVREAVTTLLAEGIQHPLLVGAAERLGLVPA